MTTSSAATHRRGRVHMHVSKNEEWRRSETVHHGSCSGLDSISEFPRKSSCEDGRLYASGNWQLAHALEYLKTFHMQWQDFAPPLYNKKKNKKKKKQQEIQDVEDENDGDTAAVSLSTEGRRLYVGNLPYAMTSSQLADIFAEAGRVASVEIVYDRVTDRSRGFAFVTMGSFEEAKEAIRLFDGSFGGRTAKVNFPEVPRGGEREVMESKIRSSNQGFVDSPHKIYAGNLSWGLTSQGLREAVQDQPGFLSAKVVYDRDTGRSRGFGFISFASAEEVDSALEAMNGVEVEGRPLRLNLAQQRSFISPPPAPETNSEPDS
nr:33 kDa ribonucleoprotein, chloroplastic-like [Coffea arabica]